MSRAHIRIPLYGFAMMLAFGAALSWTSSGRADTPRDGERNLLDEVRRLEQVAAQKLEAELRQILRDTQAPIQADRAGSIERLQKALELLNDDTSLSLERRESLKRMFTDRVRVAELNADQATGKAAPPAPQQAINAERRIAENIALTEYYAIVRKLVAIRELQEQGNLEEAHRQASELARLHPKNATARAGESTTLTADQVDKARKLQREREQRLLAGHRDIEKSATLPSGDLEFPKDWKERTKGRTTAIQLTAKEKAILQALNTTLPVNFKNSKLQDVLEYIQTYTGQTILLDKETLKDVEASYDSPVTLNARGVTVRTALRKILADLGMTYVVKDETIQAVSAQRAKETMVARRYYVGDLLAGMGALGSLPGGQGGLPNAGVAPNFFGGPFPPVVNPQVQAWLNLQALQNMQNVQHQQSVQVVEQLKELIQSSVDPQSWRANGGNGSITFHAPSMSFVIMQSAEVHAMLANGGLLK